MSDLTSKLFGNDFVNFVAAIIVATIPLFYKRLRQYVISWFKKLFEGEKFSGKEINDKIVKVNNRLLELLIMMKADRAYVYQFHNGNVFTSKQPIWKISCTNEVCARGVSYESHRTQNVIVSSIWEAVSAIFIEETDKFDPGSTKVQPATCGSSGQECSAPKGVFMYVIDQMPESYAKFHLTSQSSKLIFHAPLLDAHENVIGIVGIDFTHEDFDYSEKVQQACEVCKASTEISFILQGKS